AGRAVFAEWLDPPYGMFYAAWRNLLLAGILLLQAPVPANSMEWPDFQAHSQEIADAIAASPAPFLPSYPGQAWPVDTFPAIFSLRVYTHLADGRYEPLIAAWLAEVQAHLDPDTGLIPHRTDYQTGQTLDGARATSQALILRFLAGIDPAWGQEQYHAFRREYLVTRLGLPAVLEFPPFRPGRGDVDSGPLLLGTSLSATAAFMGTSRLYGDREVAAALWQGGEAFGMAVTTGAGRCYALGLLPVGDAFVVWSKTATPWLAAGPPPAYEPTLSPWWRWPLHAISLGLALLAGTVTWRFQR
ncbi:MAG: hypothetical protein L0322_08465, partial [Chloroflexi bacterium]|nr:hypothetical protein [Chloroflexota bacterium]